MRLCRYDDDRLGVVSGAMVYGLRRLVAFASPFYTLYPGDLLYTGSPEGVGPVKRGDVMRVECPAIDGMDVAVRRHAA